MFCSGNGSPTPLNNIVFFLKVSIKSMREEEFSVKWVGSLIICSKLNCWHKSLTFRLELSFRISRLKSPVIKILEKLVSKASPIESSSPIVFNVGIPHLECGYAECRVLLPGYCDIDMDLWPRL